MDEAAHYAGKDPLQFRLDMLIAEGRNAGNNAVSEGGAARQAAVLKKAAEMIGWGAEQAQDTGLGIASTFGQERDMPTWVACAVQVHVDKSNGLVNVQKLMIAIDAGIIVDPNGAEAQCQGAALWGLSMALYEGTELLNGQYKDTNFDTYTPLRLGQTPEVKIEFIASKMPPSGLGEPAVTPVAPAIANAIYQAVGVRLRKIPMQPSELKSALAKA
jgi:CO/xanthine dehydrogenase Mo-binding subunit